MTARPNPNNQLPGSPGKLDRLSRWTFLEQLGQAYDSAGWWGQLDPNILGEIVYYDPAQELYQAVAPAVDLDQDPSRYYALWPSHHQLESRFLLKSSRLLDSGSTYPANHNLTLEEVRARLSQWELDGSLGKELPQLPSTTVSLVVNLTGPFTSMEAVIGFETLHAFYRGKAPQGAPGLWSYHQCLTTWTELLVAWLAGFDWERVRLISLGDPTGDIQLLGRHYAGMAGHYQDQWLTGLRRILASLDSSVRPRVFLQPLLADSLLVADRIKLGTALPAAWYPLDVLTREALSGEWLTRTHQQGLVTLQRQDIR